MMHAPIACMETAGATTTRWLPLPQGGGEWGDLMLYFQIMIFVIKLENSEGTSPKTRVGFMFTVKKEILKTKKITGKGSKVS